MRKASHLDQGFCEHRTSLISCDALALVNFQALEGLRQHVHAVSNLVESHSPCSRLALAGGRLSVCGRPTLATLYQVYYSRNLVIVPYTVHVRTVEGTISVSLRLYL